jgi:hypothetical protein
MNPAKARSQSERRVDAAGTGLAGAELTAFDCNAFDFMNVPGRAFCGNPERAIRISGIERFPGKWGQSPFLRRWDWEINDLQGDKWGQALIGMRLIGLAGDLHSYRQGYLRVFRFG